MAKGSGHRGHREERKARTILNRVIGTAHREDVVLKEEKTPSVCCGGSCGRRTVHTTANLLKYGIKIGCCTSKTCQLRVLDLINEQIDRQKGQAKEPTLQPIGQALTVVQKHSRTQSGVYAV